MKREQIQSLNVKAIAQTTHYINPVFSINADHEILFVVSPHIMHYAYYALKCSKPLQIWPKTALKVRASLFAKTFV